MPDLNGQKCPLLAGSAAIVLEIKGQDTAKDQTKRKYLDAWVEAVNAHGGFGHWKANVIVKPAHLPKVIEDAVRCRTQERNG